MKKITNRAVPEIRAVLFDMDGLLIDSERLCQRALAEACGELGYAIEEGFGLQMLGLKPPEILRLFREAVPGFDARAYQEHSRRRMLELFRTELRAKPGVALLLDWLDEKGIPYVLASSSENDRVAFSLQCVGLSERFQKRVTGECSLPSKPAPDFFLAAAKMVETDPVHCLVLEDSANGVKAGRAAGAVVCMIPDLIPYSEQVAYACDFVGESLAEIPALIEEIASGK